MVDKIRSFATYQPDLEDKSILVTGGTGSFGAQFVRMVLAQYKPRRLIIFSRDEQKHFDMMGVFPVEKFPNIRFFLGDVRDQARLDMALRGVDIVVHAAAMKHVPQAEYNPFECVLTNVMGAQNIVRAAIQCGVKRVIALSTDKAANPINLYGATKLSMEKIFIAANNLSGDSGCRFSVVRYGNVIGSRGSVVPFFRKMLAEGATELPITDERMTRFWITLTQGVEFVLSGLARMEGGETFIPKIPSMRIPDLARCMAPTATLKVIGIRPGEKLHEVMVTEDDSRSTVELADRYVILPPWMPHLDASYRAEGAVPTADGFRYSSDNNIEWLTDNDLIALMNHGLN